MNLPKGFGADIKKTMETAAKDTLVSPFNTIVFQAPSPETKEEQTARLLDALKRGHLVPGWSPPK